MCDWLAGNCLKLLLLCSHSAQTDVLALMSPQSHHVSMHCRIQRDVADRGRDVAGVIEQYTQFVKPMFDQYVAPSRKHADVIIPWAR